MGRKSYSRVASIVKSYDERTDFSEEVKRLRNQIKGNLEYHSFKILRTGEKELSIWIRYSDASIDKMIEKELGEIELRKLNNG